MRYVHHNKCAGGHAFLEVDNIIYCLGRVDAAFEVKVFADECKKCPRLLDNNEDKIPLPIYDNACPEILIAGIAKRIRLPINAANSIRVSPHDMV